MITSGWPFTFMAASGASSSEHTWLTMLYSAVNTEMASISRTPGTSTFRKVLGMRLKSASRMRSAVQPTMTMTASGRT